MNLNHMHPHWSANSKAVRQTQPCANHDLRWFQPTNTKIRDTDRCNRQHGSIMAHLLHFHQDTCIGLVGLLVISAQTYCSYCNSSPDQALQSCIPQTTLSLHPKEKRNTIRNIGPRDCSSESLHRPTGLPVKQGSACYLAEVWAFLLTTSEGQRL